MKDNSSHHQSSAQYALAVFGLIMIVTWSLSSVIRAEEPEVGQTAQIQDFEMYYEIHGSGKPLLLLHGFFGCTKVWQPFVETFKERYQLIIPDLRGHGRSTNPSGAFTHRQAARDVYALLDSLEIDSVASIGISSGGMTLLHMAISQPERIDTLVPIGATTWFPEQARVIQAGFSSDDLPPMMLDCAVRGDAQLEQLTTLFRGMRHSYEDMNLTPPQLATIEARSLIIHGEHDEFFPLDIPLEMHRHIPDASLWIIPQSGHIPIYDPVISFPEVVLRFLAH